MDLDDARRLLGVDPCASEATVRAAHRRRIRRAHPDAGGTAEAAAALNAALALLLDPPARRAPRSPARRPDGRSGAGSAGPADDPDSVQLVDERPDDLLLLLAEAGHAIGEVVFVDPLSGMLEIIVGEAPAVGQLAATVGTPGADGTPVAFTLEPLGVTPAPPIADVVAALMAALQRRR